MKRILGWSTILLASACAVDDGDSPDVVAAAALEQGDVGLSRCSVQDGSGLRTSGSWDHDGYGPCVATRCAPGYHLEGGRCLAGEPCPTPGTALLYGRCEGGQLGEMPVLVIPVRFDLGRLRDVTYFGTPLSGAQIHSAITAANQKIGAMSYRRFSLAPVEAEPVTLQVTDDEVYTRNADGSLACNDWALARAALAEASRQLDVTAFEHFAFVFPIVNIHGETCSSPALSGGGWATGPHFDVPELFPIAGSVLVMSQIYENAATDVFVHESLHNLGLPHASAFDCGGMPFEADTSQCQALEYGGYNDVMGSGGLPASHTNVRFKEYLGWMTVPEVRVSGTYRVTPVESTSSALKVRRGKNTYFYLEYRTAVVEGSRCGLTVNYYAHDPAAPSVTNTFQIDMTPEDRYDAYTIAPGESFTDPGSLVTIEVLDCSATSLGLSISGL